MKEKYIEDLQEIKKIMRRTTLFTALSGLSGVSTGIIALAGAFLGWHLVFQNEDYLVYQAVTLSNENLINLLLIAGGTLLLSIGTALYFTKRETKKQNHTIWDNQSKRLLIHLLIPLATGGLLCLMLLQKGFVGFLPSVSLIFYGLALVNGSKFTFPEIRTLGIIQIVLGILAFQLIEYSLAIWALGFGAIQIVYGLIILRKN